MKKLIAALIIAPTLFVAYSQATEEIEAAFVENTPSTMHPLDPILDAMSKEDFKYDFKCYSPSEKKLNPETHPLMFKYKKVPHIKDKMEFEAAYTIMKEDALNYFKQDASYYANEIQYLFLQTLRYHFCRIVR